MQPGRLCRDMRAVFVLLILLAGCQGQGTGGGGSPSAGTARVHIQVGHDTSAPRSTNAVPTGVSRQRVGGIPPEVTRITLRVTVNGQDIAGSPLTIGLETGIASVDIKADVDHRFILEASNQQGDVIFRGEAPVNLRAGAEVDLPITLAAREVIRLVALQSVSAVAGGEVVVADPQSAVQGLRLVVPPQALARDTTLMVIEATNPANVPVLQSQVGGIVDLLESGTPFVVPATLIFPYMPPLVQDLGFDEAALRVWRFDTRSGQWTPVPRQTVDTVTHVVRAALTSLSFYTIAGPLPPASVNRSPVAEVQFIVTLEDTARAILLNGSDADDHPLTFRIVDGPTRGTLSGMPPTVTYVPNANANGRDTFTFVVNDGQQDSLPTTVTIDVLPVSDAPMVVTPLAHVHVDDSTPDTSTVLSLVSVFRPVDSSTTADTLTFTVSNNTNPDLVTTTVASTALTLTYQPRQHGSSVITVRATAQSGLFVETSFTVTVEKTFPFILNLSHLDDPSQRLVGPAN